MNKFLLVILVSCTLGATAFAQDTSYFQIKRNITIGFQTGEQLNNCPSYQYPNNNKAGRYQYTNRLLARKKITHHFDIETGINYAVIPMANTVTSTPITNRFRNQATQLSIPLSIQYNFLPETKKIRPYISAGGIYDIIKINPPAPPKGTYTDGSVPIVQNGNKNIGAQITQGVIYEVNTKIQFNENIHFIQQSNCRCFGFDIGVGYKL
jgi:outer membrane protein W